MLFASSLWHPSNIQTKVNALWKRCSEGMSLILEVDAERLALHGGSASAECNQRESSERRRSSHSNRSPLAVTT